MLFLLTHTPCTVLFSLQPTKIWYLDVITAYLHVQDLDLVMYGDSIFESLLGKQMGQSNADWADIAEVWTKHESRKSMVLAISGASMLLQNLQT